MKIIVDAMGGDKAPEEIVKGALRARKELQVELLLVGREEAIRQVLQQEGQQDLSGIAIVDARDVTTTEDAPSTAPPRGNEESSRAVRLTLWRDGR